MDGTDHDLQGFVTRLEDLCFSKKLLDGTPSDKADIVRNILVHQFTARASGLLSDNALSQLQSQYVDMYTNLVDNLDQNQGLNNFAEGALALCNLHRNESQAWKTSLTSDRFLTSVHGQKLKESCQASADQFMPPGKHQEIVELRPKDKIAENDARMHLPKSINPTTDSEERTTKTVEHCVQNFPGEQETVDTKRSASVIDSTGFVSNNDRSNPWLNFSSNGNKVKHSNCSENSTDLKNSAHEHESRRFSSTGNNVPFYQKDFSRDKGHMGNPNVSKLPFSHQGGHFSSDGGGSRFSSDVVHNFESSTRLPGNRNSNYGDQEVPKKSLFATTGGGSMAGSRAGYGCFNLQEEPTRENNFYRRGATGKRPYNNSMDGEGREEETPYIGPFKTAKEQLSINQQKKYGQNRGPVKPAAYGNVKKSLGTRRGPSSKFIPPVMNKDEPGDSNLLLRKAGPNKAPPGGEEPVDERLKGLEPKMIELIMNEIMDHGPPISWSDIAGLEFAKKTIKEIVVWPMLRPDIFTGLRGPPKGLLLFGPPGTGKTLIGKCIASQSKSTFFSISASSLTSKWVGEGEKMVRALFAVSRCHQPAVIFIDEIDSLLSQRTDGEHEASRRIKTEFLIQLDGATTESEERILVIGATNRPQEIDEAARRRFVKRLYIPLPEGPARRHIILNLLFAQRYHLTDEELESICVKTDGYSGSDMANLCREAALGPIRSIEFGEIEQISADQVRSITFQDFDDAILQVRASVSAKDLDLYIDWNKLYGCGGR